jgi:vacuolar iron transporter family protein
VNSPSQSGLRGEHTKDAIARRLNSVRQHSYLGDFMLGAVDGAVTTFAIVAGAAGAGVSNGIVLILGLSNVLADGFSMAAGNFLRARADQQLLEHFRRMEETHIDPIPEGEREKIRQIFQGKGFEGQVLESIVQVITEDRQRWVDTMLTEEWGLRLQPPRPGELDWPRCRRLCWRASYR